MDTGVGLAKLMHRTNISTNIYLPHRTPEGELLAFWNGGANVKHFSQTPKKSDQLFQRRQLVKQSLLSLSPA